jgi:sulfite oxidase
MRGRYEMNGVDLPPEHGGPLRAVVPGHVGVRNVKWVGKIVTSAVEAEGPWQRGISYKGFSPNITSFEGVDVESIQSIQEQPVTSAIIEPHAGDTFEPGQAIDARGFAWSGGGRGIVRVDVSADGGKTWTTAKLLDGATQPPNRAWAWTFWEAEIPCPPGATEVHLCCKATDVSYNSQPENSESIWNIRGLNNNASVPRCGCFRL